MKISLAAAVAAISAFSTMADDSFFKEDDRWLLTGDSITMTDTYREVVKRVMDHYHPENRICFPNRAKWGAPSTHMTDVSDKPTVVSILYGMNDIIHHEWPHKPDFSKKAEGYYANILSKVKLYKNLGAEVILFTPTLTDERVSSFFSPMYTRRGLEIYGDVIRRIGREQNCLVLPIAEELEAYDDTLGPNEIARPDGVHPFGFAQYRIAYSIIDHLNVAGKLNGKRKLSQGKQRVPVAVRRLTPFLNTADDKVVLELKAEKPIQVQLTWSLDNERGSQILDLKKGETKWTLPASAEAYSMVCGERKQAVVDLVCGELSSLYVIDLARTRVLKPANGEISFEIRCPQKSKAGEKNFSHSLSQFAGQRPEGDLVGTVRIRENQDELWLSGKVIDSEIDWNSYWITGRDNIRIMFDFRPKERFGGLNPDRDTTMILLSPRTKPEFSILSLAWWGPRFQYTIHANGAKTADGYSWLVGLAGHITDYTPFDVRKYDYYGFNLSIIDKDKNDTKLFSAMPSHFDINVEKGLNQLIIVDRKNCFPHEETTSIQLFGF